jgi:Zn-dependent hydrolases, including glyoxylases
MPRPPRAGKPAQDRIHRIRLGSPNAWLYGRPGRWLLVDAGARLTSPLLLQAVASCGCEFRDIALIVATHTHFDHIGGLGHLKRHTDAPVAVHEAEADILAAAHFVLSDGFRLDAKIKAFAARHILRKSLGALDPVAPDIRIREETRLDGFGFAAAVVPTPGHSDGSLSVLTDDGTLFSGDLIINSRAYSGVWRHMSSYGTSRRRILDTWRELLARGVRLICPGHGPAFSPDLLRRYLENA